jgi:hypothetical protein
VKGEERCSCSRGKYDSSRRRDAAGRMLPWFEDDLDRTSRSSDLSIFPSLWPVIPSLEVVVAVLCLTTQRVKNFHNHHYSTALAARSRVDVSALALRVH